jgi:hypothetical protein
MDSAAPRPEREKCLLLWWFNMRMWVARLLECRDGRGMDMEGGGWASFDFTVDG